MASITIRNLSDDIKAQLRIRAAEHQHSMEQEARLILASALRKDTDNQQNLAHLINQRFKPLGDVELELPQRSVAPTPITFESEQ